MLPISRNPPSSADDHHHTATTAATDKWSHLKSPKCITATIILHLLIIILFLVPTPLPYLLPGANREKLFTFVFKKHNECKSGKIYIYDLPSMLNKDLLENCQDLDPYGTQCNGVSNGGFGPHAAALSRVVPGNLAPAWYWTHMYIGEVIYHERILNYKCRTLDQGEAVAFYIPFYAGLAVGKYLFGHKAEERDFHATMMLNWVRNQPPWKKSNGSDHFIMLGRLPWTFRRLTDNDNDWGTKFLKMPLMKNVFRLSVEKIQSDPLEISIPYPTTFHPRDVHDIREWQGFIRSRKRPALFSFVGATRKKVTNDFRGLLMSYSTNEPKSKLSRVVDCSVVHCNEGAPEILEAFLDSDFCLQPAGDGFTRRSTFGCMVAGSIPVYFSRESFEGQYEWHLPRDAATYSVFIEETRVRNRTSIVREILEQYSSKEVEKMRETIIDFVPRILYSMKNLDLGNVSDAFDIAMDGVLRKFRQQKM